MSDASREVIDALLAARAAERRQALFYRALAAQAEEVADEETSERLNGMHADEQHHLSRLTVRLMELGAALPELPGAAESPAFEGWELEARARERAEVARYEALLALGPDAQTAALLEDCLVAERGHVAELGGKWMNA
jgi:rubrerythrin